MIVKQVKRVILGLGIGLMTNLLSCLPTWSQQFVVTPLVTIGEFKGGQAKGSIAITNKGNDPLRMRVYAESFTYDSKKGFTFTPKDNQSAVPYLQFSPRELEIPPGVTRNIRVAIAIPVNLPNQEYRASIFVEDLKEKSITSANGNALLIKARVASVFFFSKGSSTANIQARTAIWDAATKKVSLLLENQGQQTAYPEVTWRVEKDAKEVAKATIRGVIVQSQNSREVILNFNDQPLNLSSGSYSLSGNIIATGQKPTPFNIKLIVP